MAFPAAYHLIFPKVSPGLDLKAYTIQKQVEDRNLPLNAVLPQCINLTVAEGHVLHIGRRLNPASIVLRILDDPAGVELIQHGHGLVQFDLCRVALSYEDETVTGEVFAAALDHGGFNLVPFQITADEPAIHGFYALVQGPLTVNGLIRVIYFCHNRVSRDIVVQLAEDIGSRKVDGLAGEHNLLAGSFICCFENALILKDVIGPAGKAAGSSVHG